MDFKLPKRAIDSNKYQCGRLLIIAGSFGMTGAAILSSRGALNVGTGIISLALPNNLVNFVDPVIPEIITIGLKDKNKYFLDKSASQKIIELAKKNDVLAIGPGISKNCKELLKIIFSELTIPMVIDADALDLESLLSLKNPSNVIITPHQGELARLLDINSSEIKGKRLFFAKKISEELKTFVILKGKETIVAYQEQSYINKTGNAGMASAGMGDVLTGVVSGFLAQGLDCWNACLTGTFIHGLAGDIAYQEKGYGFSASDLLEKLAYAQKKYSSVKVAK